MRHAERWFLCVALAFWAVGFLNGAAEAQSLHLSTNQLVVGAKLQGSYAVPEGEGRPRFGVGLRRKGSSDYYWRQWVPKAGRGVMDLQSPIDPGDFEAVLYDEHNKTYGVAPFRTVVTPTPGALRPNKDQYVIGEPISLTVQKQENRYYGNGWVGLFQQGKHGKGGASVVDSRITWQRIPPPGKPVVFNAPADPGTYEFRLFDRDTWDYMLDRVAVKVVLPPTPGVMALEKKVFTIGEPLNLQVKLEKGRFYGNAWIGLFRSDREEKGGGIDKGHRLTYQRVNTKTEKLAFAAPPDPGHYEFRLYDRDDWRYRLDSLAFDVEVPTTPGVMSLAKDTFTIGEPLPLKVKLKPGRFYGNAWIGLFRSRSEAPGGSTIEGNRLTYQRVNTNTEQLAFATPPDPGVYEFQLYDRDDWRYRLDSLTFKVVVPTTPGVMSLAKDTFTIGEPLPLKVKLKPGRFYGNAWIGLFRKDREAPGGGYIAGTRLTYQRVNLKTEQLDFVVPPDPGEYEFQLYDRDDWHYRLDRLSFKVEVPPTPGVMTLAKKSFVIGEEVPLGTKLQPGRFYGNAWVGLFRKDREAPGGGYIGGNRLTYQRVNLKTEGLKFTAPPDPGDYEFRLYDRDDWHYLLDTIDFEVTVPRTPGVLSLDKGDYVTGEPLRLGVRMQPGRYYGNAWVGLYRKAEKTEGGAGIHHDRITYQRANLKTETLNWTAPPWPGEYEFRLFDRDAYQFQIASIGFKVTATPQSGLLSVQKARYQPGELVRVRVHLPQNRTNGSAWVELARSGYAINGGALGNEYRVKAFKVNKDTPALAFQAPGPGLYELRFYDRDGGAYILDIKTFEVTDKQPTGLERTPVRFTPLPGGPSAALAPGSGGGPSGSGGSSGGGSSTGGSSGGGEPEGLPGKPVRPDGTPVAEPNKNNGTGGGSGGDQAGGEKQPEQPGDKQSPARPSLRFLAVGANGLGDVNSLKPGQPFIIEARYGKPPESDTVTAQLSYGGTGGGGSQAVVLQRADEKGLYRSGVMRLPGGGK